MTQTSSFPRCQKRVGRQRGSQGDQRKQLSEKGVEQRRAWRPRWGVGRLRQAARGYADFLQRAQRCLRAESSRVQPARRQGHKRPGRGPTRLLGPLEPRCCRLPPAEGRLQSRGLAGERVEPQSHPRRAPTKVTFQAGSPCLRGPRPGVPTPWPSRPRRSGLSPPFPPHTTRGQRWGPREPISTSTPPSAGTWSCCPGKAGRPPRRHMRASEESGPPGSRTRHRLLTCARRGLLGFSPTPTPTPGPDPPTHTLRVPGASPRSRLALARATSPGPHHPRGSGSRSRRTCEAT